MVVMNLVRVTVGTMCLVMALGGHCQSATMSLEAAYNLAREGEPFLEVARYRVQSAEAERDVIRGRILPQLTAFGQWSDNEITYDGAFSDIYGRQKYPGERYGFEIRQSLINMSNWREVERYGALSDLSKSELAQQELETLLAVADAYLRYLIADARKAQITSEFEALTQQLEEATALQGFSLMPITEVLEIRSRTESVKADVIEATAAVTIAQETLTMLTDAPNIVPMPLIRDFQLPLRVLSPIEAAELANQFSPEIAAARDGVEAARFAVEREKGSWWPDIDLVFSQQYSDVGFDNATAPARTTDTIQLALSYPIFEGGAGSARRRAAWADFYGAQQRLEGTRRDVESSARSAWIRFEAAAERLEAARSAVAASGVHVDAAQKSVKAGTARVTDVLLALAQRTQVMQKASAAAGQYVLDWLELELLTGTSPDALAPQLTNFLFEP